MDTYKIIREDKSVHTTGLSIDEVVEIARGHDLNGCVFRKELLRKKRVTFSDDVGDLTVEQE